MGRVLGGWGRTTGMDMLLRTTVCLDSVYIQTFFSLVKNQDLGSEHGKRELKSGMELCDHPSP